MTTTPEVKTGETPQEAPQQPVEQKEVEKPPETVQEQASTVTPGQIAQQAADATVQPAAQTPADDQTITITIPATTQQLEDWAKGSPDESITWLAFFWIRLIKKAIFHGWRVITAAANPTAV